MQDRNVIGRRGGSIGTLSFIALIAIAGLIALIIWQPWNGPTVYRSSTTTTQLENPR